jgi:pimeloyl-ACP methyl ester carboxylesterase
VTYDFTWREAGSGRPVVLLHGFPIDGRLFDAQLSAADAGRLGARLIAVDMPGFGSNPLGDEAPEVLSVEDLADSLAAFLEREGLAPAVVGGVAIGGYVSIELAARRPDLVAALILMAPKPAPDSPSMAPKREEVAQTALTRGSTVVADELHAMSLGPQADGAVRAKMHEMISGADPRAIAALVRGVARRPDPALALPTLSMPTLVIAGENDPFSPLADVRRAASLLPNATFVEIKGIGHMAPIEAPLAVTRAMAAFLAGLP